MKAIATYLLFVGAVIVLSFSIVLYTVKSGIPASPSLRAIAEVSGIRRVPSKSTSARLVSASNESEGVEAQNDNFAVVIEPVVTNYSYEVWEDFEFDYGRQNEIIPDPDMVYKNSFSEQPLVDEDFYQGKFENAAAGVLGLNRMPVLTPGMSIGVVRDRYINIRGNNGYVRPANGYYFGSGVCWSTSTLGFLLDNANSDFRDRYGLDLFVYGRGDRAPHGDYYETYGGRGYTILQAAEGVPVQDYRFTVNPAISKVPELADLKMKIVMLASDDHASAAYGQSIAGYIVSNKDF
ncbi:MAG: hypothetical protein TR69_WS6001000423 [candidate division WS6 bacterium OLB20]|uniref:Uncharacterized protein n=1 Tax=candidate division WS6 bacterium OLB20 TaxID=1617426 RepID=A0A136LXN0_9BACT|nr:MAG: hypothetical protein TR69_WS6001000423 [candidate division WS6 bacterium OLB20]